jgi:hypothetical protein
MPTSIQSLREDSFSQLLQNGNVRPGGRYLVVDDTGGLVLGGMIERMGGRGRILTLTDSDSPPTYHILQNQMNFPPELISKMVGSLNWHVASPNWVPVDEEPLPTLEAAEAEAASASASGMDDATKEVDETPGVKKGRVKTNKLGRLRKKLRAREELLAVREEFLLGEWDGCVHRPLWLALSAPNR